MNHTETEKLKEHEKERDFFCVDPRCLPCLRPTLVGYSWQRVGLRGSGFHHRGLGLTGPAFHFSDTWQLIINTGTTIVTFLMVFLIQTPRTANPRRCI